jgi:hypothetical protein
VPVLIARATACQRVVFFSWLRLLLIETTTEVGRVPCWRYALPKGTHERYTEILDTPTKR